MSTTRCVCCDLPIESCGREAVRRMEAEAKITRAGLLGQKGWITAQFASRCAWCGEAIKPGDPIKSDDNDGWRGGCCA